MDRPFRKQLVQIGILLLAMYVIHLLSVATGGWALQFGIVPRTLEGVRGIVFSPFLHGSWSHLIANTAPLAVMLTLLAISRRQSLWTITVTIWLLTGVAVWLVGRPGSVQVGASGIIFGLAAFLVATAWLTRHLGSALIALVVIFLYGSIIWGVLPGKRGVSWEGHLCGMISGIVVANLAVKRRRMAA
ncbi:MAG: rhomboid family intramembrane serine protease [Verrucomicrobiaceae bacterium]|nr:MAG: rhomboid family intramembrane serine protease [Verrucomicrobiaceae bacterium]